MKIRFCPGIWWKTCAVQTVGSAPVRIVARIDRFLAGRRPGVGLPCRRGCARPVGVESREAVGVDAPVADRVVDARGARCAGREDAAAALVGREQELARRGKLRLVVEVVVLVGSTGYGPAASLVMDAAEVPDARERRRADREPARDRQVLRRRRPTTQSVTIAPGRVRRRGRARANVARQRRPLRLAVLVERPGVERRGRRARLPLAARQRAVRIDLELVTAVDVALVGVAEGDRRARVAVAVDLRPARARFCVEVVPTGKFMHEERSTTSKPSRSNRSESAGSSFCRSTVRVDARSRPR